MVRFAFIFLLLNLSYVMSWSQPWVDNQFEIRIDKDSVYGESVNFSGNSQKLLCDIAYPVDDVAPECGRPLIILVHGGSFIAGSKEDFSIQVWLTEFAKKGYVAAAINYRLGMYQTADFISCAVENWGCLNMADSAEWYRANYRGMQDCKGAIRYMISQKELYNINKDQVFLIGESAGGFVALQAAYLDDASEKSPLCYELPDVIRPSLQYQETCLPPESLPIADMSLKRPDLGSFEGNILNENGDFKIRGVASVYGGIMFDFLNKNDQTTDMPVLYVYAQPNDLIVPFRYDRVMAGISACASQYSGCPWLVNTPYVYGNHGIKDLIDQKAAAGLEVPEIKADFTQNTADCLLQVAFPALSGHAMDDIWVRTNSIATFFAEQIAEDDCILANDNIQESKTKVYPNPFTDVLNISMEGGDQILDITVYDHQYILRKSVSRSNDLLELSRLEPGLYMLIIRTREKTYQKKVIKI